MWNFPCSHKLTIVHLRGSLRLTNMWFFVLKTLIFVQFATAYVCNNSFFENTVINVTTNENVSEIVRLNKCPMSTIILSENTREITCKNQRITDLAALSVSYLHYLEVIILTKNRIKYIRPNAFYELSSLKLIDLSDNDIEEIWNGCFNSIKSLKHLILKKNLIKKIGEFAFVDMTNLRTVDFSYNELDKWQLEWFATSPQLDDINMILNRVKFLPRNAFAKNKNLTDINFAHNEITSVHSEAFNGLNNLYQLRLDNNRIQSFREDTFLKAFGGLNFFYLNNNRLTYLPKKMLENLTNVSYLNIHSNPFQCACYREIWHWLKKNKNKIRIDNFKKTCTRKSNPVCVSSYTNPKTCVETIDNEVEVIYWKNFKDLSSIDRDDDFAC